MVYNFYAVRGGRTTASRGIYTSWKDCEKEVKNVTKLKSGRKACFKGFYEKTDAETFLNFGNDADATLWARRKKESILSQRRQRQIGTSSRIEVSPTPSTPPLTPPQNPTANPTAALGTFASPADTRASARYKLSTAHAADRTTIFTRDCTITDLTDEIAYRKQKHTELQHNIEALAQELQQVSEDKAQLVHTVHSLQLQTVEKQAQVVTISTELQHFKDKFESPFTGYWAEQADAWSETWQTPVDSSQIEDKYDYETRQDKLNIAYDTIAHKNQSLRQSTQTILELTEANQKLRDRNRVLECKFTDSTTQLAKVSRDLRASLHGNRNTTEAPDTGTQIKQEKDTDIYIDSDTNKLRKKKNKTTAKTTTRRKREKFPLNNRKKLQLKTDVVDLTSVEETHEIAAVELPLSCMNAYMKNNRLTAADFFKQ